MLGTLMTSPADPCGGRLVVETASSEIAARITLRGEADAANLEQLQAALSSIELDGQKVVHIDMSDLVFIDVPALRQLTLFAMQMRQDGHDVTTRGGHPLVHDVARILNVRDELGLS